MTKNDFRARGLGLAGCCLALLSGCAHQSEPLYHWGDFQTVQYAHFKGEKGPEAGIVALEKIREDAKAKGRALPPGLQAHLGMLYGLTGRGDLFEQNLRAEKHSFPESSVYLDFLLKQKQGESQKVQVVQ